MESSLFLNTKMANLVKVKDILVFYGHSRGTQGSEIVNNNVAGRSIKDILSKHRGPVAVREQQQQQCFFSFVFVLNYFSTLYSLVYFVKQY